VPAYAGVTSMVGIDRNHTRYSGEGRNLDTVLADEARRAWVPAYAGMTAG
jgi:hypothetical protein